MIIVITGRHAELAETDDFGRFSVDAGGEDLDAVDAALTRSNAGVVEGDGAVIRCEFLNAHAEPSAQWQEGFAAMLDYAGAKGWITPSGDVRAHIENLG